MDAPADPPAVPLPVPPPAAERTYDVYFTTSAQRFYFRNRNCGVTLAAGRIAWTFDGQADSAPLSNIVEVRLQSGGGDWRDVLAQCIIRFADDSVLTVTDANDCGLPDDAQRRPFRAFVRDLHARMPRAGVAYNAGFPSGRYRVLIVLAGLLGLICVVLPLGLLLFTLEIKVLSVLVVGAVFLWPLVRMMQNNAPRAYDPAHLPEELLE